MDNLTPILSTKLFFPPTRPTLIPRPRLVEHLSEGLTRPLTLISAPAGFGKTTLVSEWRDSNAGQNFPVAYISLDSDDNDPSHFLTYLAAALGTVKPDLRETALLQLQSPQPPPLQAFLTGLINELGEYRSHFALVLDDYHVITAQPVHEALSFLLDHLPQHMHLMILTRADPPLPLARLRGRNQLIELRAADLRFTAREAASFFSQGMGLNLSADEINGLDQRTEGWIAGLQLAALAIKAPSSMQGNKDISGFITAFTGSHRFVADYLVTEVLSRQPESMRSFLLQTSILGRMKSELCDRLLGRNDSLAMLQQLETANLFLVPLDEERQWYRYHHLFADVMRAQLRQAFPDQLANLHHRAAEWYEQNGFVSEAIQHALAGEDQLFAARLIENNALAMLFRGDAVTVLKWISSIAPIVHERPWLGIYQSWALICINQLENLESLLQAIEDRSGALAISSGMEGIRYHVAGIRALAAVRRGEARQAIELARRALEQLPESDTVVRSVVIYTLGEANWAAGDLAGARRVFAEASRIDRAAGNFLAAALAYSSVAVLLTEEGELHSAAETYRTAVQLGTLSDGRLMPAAARACQGLAELEYEWNDLDAAGRHAQQALELGRRWGNPDTLIGIHLVRARLQQAQGDTVGTFESLPEADELAKGQDLTPLALHHLDAFHVRLWLAQGNLDRAARWARQHTLAPGDEISYPHQIAYLTLARILMAQNQVDTALALLERLLEQFESFGQMGRVLEVLLLQSLVLDLQGNTPQALTVLARALTIGQSEDWMRIFLDEGAPMAKLLRRAGSQGVSPKYVARLLSQFDQEIGATPARQQPLIEPLTDRELQVLRLMIDGLSNQDIANLLVVALGTVKTHTASLYRKLNVGSRSQAAARARELGIL